MKKTIIQNFPQKIKLCFNILNNYRVFFTEIEKNQGKNIGFSVPDKIMKKVIYVLNV